MYTWERDKSTNFSIQRSEGPKKETDVFCCHKGTAAAAAAVPAVATARDLLLLRLVLVGLLQQQQKGPPRGPI